MQCNQTSFNTVNFLFCSCSIIIFQQSKFFILFMQYSHNSTKYTFHIFSCDQAALWMVFSVHLSVCLSVTPFWLCFHHCIIMKFSGVITNDKNDIPAKGQGQRSKVKVTEVNTQLNRFRTVTPVWIHIWWRNGAYSLMMLRRGALVFLAATKQLYKWYFLSVCPSVCPSVRLSVCLSVRLSVCHTFLTMFPSSYHHEIFRSYHIGPG